MKVKWYKSFVVHARGHMEEYVVVASRPICYARELPFHRGCMKTSHNKA